MARPVNSQLDRFMIAKEHGFDIRQRNGNSWYRQVAIANRHHQAKLGILIGRFPGNVEIHIETPSKTGGSRNVAPDQQR